MTEKHTEKCGKCNLKLRNTQYKITCSLCTDNFHIKCQSLSKTDVKQLANLNLDRYWTCNSCTDQILPGYIDAEILVRAPKCNKQNQRPPPSYCYSCNKILGKITKKCDFCDCLSHAFCHMENMGCVRCLKDIYPGFTCTTADLFESNFGNDHRLFNPYNPNSYINKIGNVEFFETIDEEIAWQSVSENLNNCKYEKLNDVKASRKNELKILSLNIRSLNTAFPRLQDISTHLNKFDCLSFNESGCKTDSLPFGTKALTIDGFHTPIIQDPTRSSGRGGGLIIYVNKKLCADPTKISVCSDLCSRDDVTSGEHLYIEIDMGHHTKNIIIGSLYRSPSHHPENFLNKHKENLENLKQHKNKTIVIAGDSNINLLTHLDYEPASTLLNMYSEHGFAPLISRPTRITNGSATLIDHIFANNCHKVTRSGVITLDVSDHLATYTTILLDDHDQNLRNNVLTEDNSQLPPCKGNFSNQNYERFRLSAKYLDWETVFNTDSADKKFDIFSETYTEYYNQAFLNPNDQTPTKSRRKPRKNTKPWMQDWLAGACDRKNRAYHTYIGHPTIENQCKYKKLKIFVEKHIAKAKRDYYTKYFKKHESDSRKQWSMINQILNRTRKSHNIINKLVINDKVINKTADITETFNEYFTNIAKNLKEHGGTTNNSYPSTLNTSRRSQISIDITPCSETEILTIIKSFQNKATSDT